MMLLCLLLLGSLDSGSAFFPDLGKVIPNPSDVLNKVPKPSDVIDVIPDALNPLNIIFQNKCIEAIGCFYTGPPFFNPIHRPISLTPTSIMKTKFWLYTRSNPKEREDLKPTMESLQNSSFNPQLPVKVLVHGFRSGLGEDDIRFPMKDALLKVGDFNVIIVDWTEHNGPPYLQAVANARAVGAHLAKLLNFITNNTEARAENMHIIGHSLGSHVSGWAGERIANLGRITGLDPAGPYFQEAGHAVRLDATDAQFVDIIHTDGGNNVIGGLGIYDPIGHMDFYPNAGQRQPGCVISSESETPIGGIINATFDFPLNTCDHERANKFFLESIDNSECRFLATWCNDYDDFEQGDCLPQNSTMAEMGFHAKRIPGVPMKSKFFLRTNDTSPFCIEDSVYL